MLIGVSTIPDMPTQLSVPVSETSTLEKKMTAYVIPHVRLGRHEVFFGWHLPIPFISTAPHIHLGPS
jgi:hypothetical protein